MDALDRFFGISAAGSTARRELTGGLTTFATMSYIIFVQPAILSAAGMDRGSVLVATCLAAAVGTLLMGVFARYPFAMAPGMGQNFLFAFTVCAAVDQGGMGFSWESGLAIVLISGVLFLLLSLFEVRERLIGVLPNALKNAIGPAIGIFIAFVGLQWGGIIVADPGTLVRLASLREPQVLLTCFGIVLTASLLARGVRWSILVGIIATAGLGWLTGAHTYEMARIPLSVETFFRLDFGPLVTHWDRALIAIALFFFLDLFDTVGTLVGVSKQAGFITEDDERLPRAGRAFFSDAFASCAGALFGTSTVTTYVESASGVAVGARTGLAAVVTAACFVAAIAVAPFFPLDQATVAPALVVVGFCMMAPLRRVDWDDVTESFPAFSTVTIMAFGFGITEGIAMGCITYVLISVVAGKARTVHPVMYVVALALAARYAFLY